MLIVRIMIIKIMMIIVIMIMIMSTCPSGVEGQGGAPGFPLASRLSNATQRSFR